MEISNTILDSLNVYGVDGVAESAAVSNINGFTGYVTPWSYVPVADYQSQINELRKELYALSKDLQTLSRRVDDLWQSKNVEDLL